MTLENGADKLSLVVGKNLLFYATLNPERAQTLWTADFRIVMPSVNPVTFNTKITW